MMVSRAIFAWCIMGTLLVGLSPVSLWSEAQVSDVSPTLTASLAPDAAKLGSMVVLTLSYQLPEGARLPEKPEIKGLEGLTIVERRTEPGRIRIKVLVDRLDRLETGPLSLSYLDKEGQNQVLTTPPVSMTVSSNLGEKPAEAQLRPIQGIIPTRAVWLEYLPWAGVLLGGLVILTGVFWWYRKRRAKIVAVEAELPPDILARRHIEQLEAQGLFERGEIKKYYFRFSEILRQYLESLRGFPAAEFTTEEIARRIDHEQDRKLLPLLQHADLVKFADTVPTVARKDEEVKTALSYIAETGAPMEINHSTQGSQGAV